MIKHTKKTSTILEMPAIKIVIGPGTVPTSRDSVKQTSMKVVAKELRKASRTGLFDKSAPFSFCD